MSSSFPLRRFAPLLGAQTLGALNDNLFRYALVTLATFEGLTILDLDRQVMVPIAATALTLPIFLFSAVAGQVADRWDRMAILRITKLAEIVLMTLAALAFWLNSAWLLLGTLFAMGVQSAFFIPARSAAMPSLLQGRALIRGNAMMSGAVNMAILIGAGLGTGLVRQDQGPLIIGAILILVGVLGWASIRAGAPLPVSDPSLKVRWNIIGETARQLRFAYQAKPVFRALLGVAWFWMLAAAIVTLLPLYCAEVLGADETVVLVFSALFTVCAALGAIICGALARHEDSLLLSLIGAVGLIAFPLDIMITGWGQSAGETLIGAKAFFTDPAHWRITFDLAMAAICTGLYVVPLQAMAQRRADPEKRARLLAAGSILYAASASLGQFVLAGLNLAHLPLQGAFGFIALGSLAVALFMAWRMSLRHTPIQSGKLQ
ncbi:MFS transporter [Woodsholea maritima]|uniref:MFS transporter n=1 Tax=Woodsholea maritima TaxID=240237 RepID=UPI0003821AB3|nr:MFS transporter [Woodsholea maritima]